MLNLFFITIEFFSRQHLKVVENLSSHGYLQIDQNDYCHLHGKVNQIYSHKIRNFKNKAKHLRDTFSVPDKI